MPRKAELKCTWKNTACEVFNFREHYTYNVAISFYAGAIYVQFIVEHGAQFEWRLNIDFHFAIITCLMKLGNLEKLVSKGNQKAIFL
jgi:hypothetical protein